VSQLVRYELSGQIARVTMDDGKVNAMSVQMLHALHDAFDRAAGDSAVVVLRSGRVGIFSAGFDLKVLASDDVEGSHAMVKAGAELALKILSFRTPVLGVCAGHAYPMGAFLLLASDIRIGVDGPYRIGFNEVAIGIPIPSFALELGRQRLTPAYLNRTATTGEMFGMKEAVSAGFLDRLVPAEGLDAAVEATAEALTKIHLPSHAIVKQRLRSGTIKAMRAAIDAELTIERYRELARDRSSVNLSRAG